MSLTSVFQVGKFYNLEDIKYIVGQFERVASKKLNEGLFHLYKQKNSSLFWIGGPFHGPNTTQFLYMGEQESKDQTLKTLKEALSYIETDDKDYSYGWGAQDFYFASFFDDDHHGDGIGDFGDDSDDGFGHH